MGKAERNRRSNAREKIAAQQAAARRREARRRTFLAGGSVLAVVAIVLVIIIAKGLSGSPATAGSGTAAQAESVSKLITTVQPNTLDLVGKGAAETKLIPTEKGQPLLESGGKPEVLFIGAEYCPYCAAERWALAVALSRFGTLSNLSYLHSSSTDTYPNTPGLSFYKSSYSSKYISFSTVELYSTKKLKNGDYATLQTPTKAQAALMGKYDAPPYITKEYAGSYPFIDIGNQYLNIGAQYDPSSIDGLTWRQVANDIRSPYSTVGQYIDGAANSITAAICKITKDAPANVCTSAAVKAGASQL